jgi:hypothetical protein
MIRAGHILHDLREGLGSPKLLLPLLVVAGFFTFLSAFSLSTFLPCSTEVFLPPAP